MTEQAALSQLRQAYRGTGLEVRFYPDCCTMAEGRHTAGKTKSRHTVKRDG